MARRDGNRIRTLVGTRNAYRSRRKGLMESTPGVIRSASKFPQLVATASLAYLRTYFLQLQKPTLTNDQPPSSIIASRNYKTDKKTKSKSSRSTYVHTPPTPHSLLTYASIPIHDIGTYFHKQGSAKNKQEKCLSQATATATATQ